jgi:hypothetical protein
VFAWCLRFDQAQRKSILQRGQVRPTREGTQMCSAAAERAWKTAVHFGQDHITRVMMGGERVMKAGGARAGAAAGARDMMRAGAERVMEHVVCATEPLAAIDILGSGRTERRAEFVIIRGEAGEIDYPAGFSAKEVSYDALALSAFSRAGGARWAFVQGRSSKKQSAVHMRLAHVVQIGIELPYTVSIGFRALRGDIQRYVGEAAFRLVTSAPTHRAVNELFEGCLTRVLEFELHSAGWRTFKDAFQSLSCSATVCTRGKASISVGGVYLRMARRDVILVVMVMLFSGGALGPVRSAGWLTAVQTVPAWLAGNGI